MTDDRPETIEPDLADGERDSPSADELLARLQDTERERDEVLDNLRRVAADFDNYRKRVAREQAQLHTRAGERVVVKLLPVLDDLVRALEAAEHHEEAKVLEGVRMTKDALAAEYGRALYTGVFYRNPQPPPTYEAQARERKRQARPLARPRHEILEMFRPQ